MLSVLRFRVTQNFVNIIFLAYGGAILLIGLAGLLAIFGGHGTTVDYAPHNWLPTAATATFYSAVILALLGIEVPLNMGVEVAHPRAITRYLFWGAAVVIVGYLLGTFGILNAVPLADQGNPSAVAEAVQRGFGGAGNFLGILVNIIFIGFFTILAFILMPLCGHRHHSHRLRGLRHLYRTVDRFAHQPAMGGVDRKYCGDLPGGWHCGLLYWAGHHQS